MEKALNLFHPLIKEWFSSKYGSPTDVQQKAWPLIAGDKNILVTAPTGSGKTLTAFLWALNLLITGKTGCGKTSVLYISPLKALNNDIKKNLTTPLLELEELFSERGEVFPSIRALTRSGDTAQSERRKMLRYPPEILITTPESINLLLSSRGGRSILTDIDTVILDEIHSVAGTKRGTHLMSAVERLTLLSGEFKRISLSATVKPLEKVKEFVSGRKIEGDLASPVYRDRDTEIVRSEIKKNYRIAVSFPAGRDQEKRDSVWESVADDLNSVLNSNRSTLIFTNGRKLCEKLTFMLNKGDQERRVFSHHGSLSKEIRVEVEKRLREGKLSGIVATNSLEMGIDIGDLDEVVLVQSPPSVSSAVQRIGRAGHKVNEVSKGSFYPSHGMDILESATLARAVKDGDIEELKIVDSPLDVLCQILISMTGVETWSIDELYNFIVSIYPYRNLSFEMFENLLSMLSGKYEDSRIRELGKKLIVNKKKNSVVAAKGALLSLYMGGGTIPDRGYYTLRDSKTGSRIGELDEEYVWEASKGQMMTIGAQNWRVRKITHNDVFVEQAANSGMDIPFWIGESFNRDYHFSVKISELLSLCDGMFDRTEDERLASTLVNEYCLKEDAATKLLDYLKLQRQKTATELPHRKHVVYEEILSGPGKTPYHQTVIHTFWGGCLNRPYGIALKAAFEDKYDVRIEVFSDNNCIVLMLPDKDLAFENLVTSSNVELYLREGLEKSGFFGARFRECAGRALLINKQNINSRMPLWITRLKSKKLFDSVSKYSDFPILTETYRTCLSDEFDLTNLILCLKFVESGEISVTRIKSRTPSPMAENVSWEQINKYMYEDDANEGGKKSDHNYDLVSEMVWSRKFRVEIEKELADVFNSKLLRTYEGYSPSLLHEFVDFVNDLTVLTEEEYKDLLEAVKRDHGVQFTDTDLSDIVRFEKSGIVLFSASDKLDFHRSKGVLQGAEDSAGNCHKYKGSIDESPENTALYIHEWLKFRGPTKVESLNNILFDNAYLNEALTILEDNRSIVKGTLIKGDNAHYVCEAENYEILIRISRKERKVDFKPLGLEKFQPFLAEINRCSENFCDIEKLYKTFEKMVFFPVRGDLWEKEILPSRFKNYNSAFLDSLMQEGELLFLGSEPKNIQFGFFDDLDLIKIPDENDDLMLLEDRSFGFKELSEFTGKNFQELSPILWDNVFKGNISNDTFISVRKGFENNFEIKDIAPKRGSRRRGRSRAGVSIWKGSVPVHGNFFKIKKSAVEDDPISVEERNRAKVRILLDRYGIISRQILQREVKEFSWGVLFKSLRIMELSGEVLSGVFFEGIMGPQFISKKAFKTLKEGGFENRFFWVNAMDPISVTSMGFDVKKRSKKRSHGTHYVYKGSELILTSVGSGRELFFEIKPDDAIINETLDVIEHVLSRQFMPKSSIKVEKINGEISTKSDYLGILSERFDLIEDHKSVTLYKRV